MSRKKIDQPEQAEIPHIEMGEQRNIETEIVKAKQRADSAEILVRPRGETEYSPIEIIRRAQETIQTESKKLQDERQRYISKIEDIDRILAELGQTATPVQPTTKRGRKSGAGGSTKDIILNFLADGNIKTAKDITAAVVAAGKSKVIGAALKGLTDEKKITNPARGQYKLK